jgi:hypothetical protein
LIRHILRKIPPKCCPVSLSPFALSLSKGERVAQDRLVEGRRHAIHASTRKNGGQIFIVDKPYKNIRGRAQVRSLVI